MHILEIPSFFPPHGGLFCLEQAKALAGLGHEVRIVSCTQLGTSIDGNFFFSAPVGREWIEMDGVECYRTFLHGIPKTVKPNYLRWVHTVKSMYREYKKRYGKPDILHAHCAKWAGIAAMEIAERENIPYFITEHFSYGMYEADFGKGWTKNVWAKEKMKEAYHNAKCVIPVAKELIDSVENFFGKDFNYREISNITDTDFFITKKREPLSARPFRFCCIGFPNIFVKGYDVLAEAMKGIQNIELHIAGVSKDNKKVPPLFADYSNVYFHGKLNKAGVRDLLYHCDALVLASRSEVQPLVLLEAMSTGIPVISTEVVPQSERIENACTIIPTGDSAALHEGMKQLILRGHDYDGESFHKAVENLSSPMIVAKKLEELFSS
ncbi:MAG: glycosyltransferase [Prevotellaceae bacterium]|nr:glycosyltransferase [Candidatus Minthosoma equi]